MIALALSSLPLAIWLTLVFAGVALDSALASYRGQRGAWKGRYQAEGAIQ